MQWLADFFFSPTAADWFLSIVVPLVLAAASLGLWRLLVLGSGDRDCALPLPPGSVGLPIVGETLQLAAQGYDFFRARRQRYGRVYKTHILGRPTIRVYGSSNLRTILSAEDVLVTMHWPKSVRMLMGAGGLAQTVSSRLHGARRASLAKAFAPSSLTAYASQTLEVASLHLEDWCGRRAVLAFPECRRLALEVTARSLFGMQLSETRASQMCDAMSDVESGFFSLPYAIPGTGLSKAVRARQFVLRQLDERFRQLSSDSNDNDGCDVMTVLRRDIDSGEITLDEAKDICMEMLFSGFQGLASSLCTLLMELERHPHCLTKAAAELRDLEVRASAELGGGGGRGIEALLELPYLGSVVKEALRVAPPVGGGYRKVLKTFELDGYQIPKGWTVLYSIRDQHEAGDTGFDNPTTFNPERWMASAASGTGAAAVDEFAYIPFGGSGRHACVGQAFVITALTVVMSQLIGNSQWKLLNPNPTLKHFPVPYPADYLPVAFSAKRCVC